MSALTQLGVSDDMDKHVDAEIAACLDLDAPRSFFLFAGAGSGKTSSLVTALKHVQSSAGDRLRFRGQRVAVITYTNAASDEIKRRMSFDPLIDVRTIHSFAWSLVEGFNHDIREWLRIELAQDIEKLEAEEDKGRKGTKASATRLSQIESKTRRLRNLSSITSFTYSPSGDNRGRDALNHAEVLKIAASFLRFKPAMQSILCGRHPILLIDESQDTNKYLVDAFFEVEEKLKGKFSLGLLGDMMQRIYTDGKEGLGVNLPAHWATPTKRLNYRCPKRIIALINKIRDSTDKQAQQPISSAKDGVLRLFILPTELAAKSAAEKAIALYMAKLSRDEKWGDPKAVKTLTLEHRMAASRMGFAEAFGPLYDYGGWRTSFLDGSLSVSRFFADQVLALVKAKRAGNRFLVARIAKANSPRLSPVALREASDAKQHLDGVSTSIDAFMKLWDHGADPSLFDVLKSIADHQLFEIPESLKAHASGAIEEAEAASSKEDESEDPLSERELAIQGFLEAPFSQIEPMTEYLSGHAHFDTHQGVKGLEFDRVMVIMDDSEARGFTFKYEDLFGGKAAGDRTVETTRRLFYVTASRAQSSLALVAYSSSPDRVRSYVQQQGWFDEAEVIVGVPS